MPAPYPLERRDRAVLASDELGVGRAAELLRIGTATVKRWRRLGREQGSLTARPMGGDRRGGSATDAAVELAVQAKPDSVLAELVIWFLGRGRRFSESGIWRSLKRMRFHRRRKSVLAAERSSERVLELRRDYLAAVAKIDPNRLVFLDESGCQRGMQRPLAWRRAGSVVVSRSVRNRGTVTTVLGALSARGLVAVMDGEGATTTEVFVAYLREVVIPELQEGDVVVMDNLGAHQPDAVRTLLEAAGVAILFLPPYSPELNPIELAWSKVKTFVRARRPQSLVQLHRSVKSAVGEVCEQDAAGWFAHCGYPLLRTVCRRDTTPLEGST